MVSEHAHTHTLTRTHTHTHTHTRTHLDADQGGAADGTLRVPVVPKPIYNEVSCTVDETETAAIHVGARVVHLVRKLKNSQSKQSPPQTPRSMNR